MAYNHSEQTLFQNNSREDFTNYLPRDKAFDSSINAIASVEKYVIPIICVVGLFGNTCSFIVFLHKSLRTRSCSLFLATRSMSDNGFLVILLIVWISTVFELHLSKIDGVCQVMIFLTYVFGCVSVWLVVFVTTENYIRMCRPYMVKSLCKITTAKFAVMMLIVGVMCCYNFPLWTMSDECEPNRKHYGFIRIMVYADSFLTLVLPTVIMTILMTHIAVSSVTSCKVRRRLNSTFLRRKSINPVTKVTTMLIAVTLTFFILNMPSHVARLRLLIISFTKGKRDITESFDLTLQSVSQLLYYLSIAINILVYYAFGSLFRGVLNQCFNGKWAYTKTNTNSSATTLRRNRHTLPELSNPDSYYVNSDIDEKVRLHRMRSSV